MDKWLDRLIDNRIFMKVVALVLALLLFGSIYDENGKTNDINVPVDQDTAIIAGIPVKSYYDTENLVVTGVPETVEVALAGPIPNVQAAKTQKDFEVYVDLTQAKVGNQRVKVQIRDLSDKITATINPTYVEVNVQEKVTKEYTVDVQIDSAMVADGYKLGTPVISPGKVEITGGKEVMDKVTYVKAIVDAKENIDDTIDQTASLTVLDQNLNKLNVIPERATVRVMIPVTKVSKKVPIEIVEKGSPPEGKVIESITLDKKEVRIYGNEETLSDIEDVQVEIDISQVSKSTEMNLSVIASDDIIKVDPETVKASIEVQEEVQEVEPAEEQPQETEEQQEAEEPQETAKVEEEVEKTFNLPIGISGLSDAFEATIQEPLNAKINLTILGTHEEIEKVKETDFRLFVNVAGLSAGAHEVKLQVDGPEQVEWKLSVQSIHLEITEKQLS